MASDQPGGGLKLGPGKSILESAEKALAEQEQNTFRATAIEDHGQVGAEVSAKGYIGKGWSWRAVVDWWKGDKSPSVYGGIEKKW